MAVSCKSGMACSRKDSRLALDFEAALGWKEKRWQNGDQ